MEGKEKDGLVFKNRGMYKPQSIRKTDYSKKRNRGEEPRGSGVLLGLPPKSSKCHKNSKRRRIQDLRHVMGGGCSFPTSKNVIQPSGGDENFDAPARSQEMRVKQSNGASPLTPMQLNIGGRMSRKGSLYEASLDSEGAHIPLLVSYCNKSGVNNSPPLTENVESLRHHCANGCEGNEHEIAVGKTSKAKCQKEYADDFNYCDKTTRTQSASSTRTSPSITTASPQLCRPSGDQNASLLTPDLWLNRMRTSLSESDSVFVVQSGLSNSCSRIPGAEFGSTKDIYQARNHEFAIRHSVGSADLINNCSLGSMKQHSQLRAASVSGASSELHPSASPRYRRMPTVENSVCFQEDDQINYYQILDEVGRGSYGSVYKCFSYKDKKYYAMKIISKKRLIRKTGLIARHPKKGKTNPLDALHREIAILKKVDHPNVVRLIEVIDDPQIDNVYMVFEIMEKGPIIELPTKEPLSEEKTRQYFRDIVLGIEYLHFSKIMHRDIKPSNLLLGDDGHVKIADFGVSDMFEDDDDMLNKFAGSPAFQSPEAIAGSRDKFSGKAADIWALGITLFSCIYGECPFYSSDVFKLYELIKSSDVSFPEEPTVDPQLQDLMSRMLAKDPKTRISIGEIKKHPWITRGGSEPLPDTESHCVVIEVTEEEVKKSVKLISKLSSLVLVKSMIRRRRLSVASAMPQKFRSHSSPEFVVENAPKSTTSSDELAP